MGSEGAETPAEEEAVHPVKQWLAKAVARVWRKSAPESEEEASEVFRQKVFAREIEYIQDRWRAVDSDHPKKCPEDQEHEETPAVSTENQLVGLAFSGGGIRSATFNLGVLQVLQRRGVLRFVDYLSTVSGGGFLGASLSTLLSENARRGEGERLGEFPYEFSSTENEPAAVSYLRNNSNYLAPRGVVDYLRIFAVLVRGILLNFSVLMPLLLICAMVVTVIFGQDLLDRLREDEDRRALGVLLDRTWPGLESDDRRVRGLLAALENESAIDTRHGMSAANVVQWLRGKGIHLDEEEQRTLPPLVSGSGDLENYEFRPGVTREEIVRRLWESKTLRSLDAMREVDAIERLVRAEPGFRDNPSVLELFGVLEANRAALRAPRGTSAETVSLLWDPDAVRFVWALTEQGLIERPEACFFGSPTGCPFKEGVTLRQVLQQLYERGLLEPWWLQLHLEQTPFAPPLAYWEFYEIARIEGRVFEALPGARDAEPWEIVKALLELGAFHLEMISLAGRELHLGDYADSEHSVQAPDGSEVLVRAQPDLTVQAVVRELYERGLLDPEWFASVDLTHDPLAYVKYHELAYYGDFGLEIPPWDPFRLRLPFSFALMVLGILWILAFPLILSLRRLFLLRWRSRLAIGCGCLLFLPVAFLPIWLFWPEGQEFLSVVFSYGLLISFFLYAIAVENFSRVAVGVVAVVAIVWLVRRFWERRSAMWWRDHYERSFSLLLIAIAAVAFVEIQPYLIFHYKYLQAGRIWWTLGIGAVSLLASMLAGPALAVFKKAGRTMVILVVGVLGPILPMLVYMHLVILFIYAPGREFREWAWDGHYLLNEPFFLGAFGVLALLVHVVNLPLDVNSTSLHGFYRDRLSQAYLLRRKGKEEIEPADDLSLSEICPDGSGAPYHLINATLNLQGSRDPRLRRRRGDFFFFSRFFIGGQRTGYCRTTEMERVFPFVPLGSAMAVSAAAASPNMGTFTFGPMVILMALLNIRLGYWIPNPHQVNRWSSAGRPLLSRAWRAVGRFVASLIGSFRARPGGYLLLKEMFSLMHDNSRLVNLTDGGHMENTGVFELLRRRCRFIIIGDAEADPMMQFGGLAALIRYARIDLGVEIEIHVDDLRLDEEGQSRQHCALGTIHYPDRGPLPAEVGYLLYIKSSFTGDEDELVSEYRTRSPAFPHESTADQSFTEGQFEAYRDLGYHITDGLFEDLGKDEITSFREFGEWFDVLRVDLMPGLAAKVEFADIKTEMGKIERMLREDKYSDYFYEIYPDLRPEGTEPPAAEIEPDSDAFRHVFHLVNIQLQLMESLFVSLELDQSANREHPANRGWMNLFTRWAQARSFRRAYLPSIATYSAPFQQFCRVALGLKMVLTWSRLTEAKREAMAAHAEEIGLRLLQRPVESGQTGLLLTVQMEGINPIPIGAALLASEEGAERVVALKLRPGYQGAGIRAQAVLELRRSVEREDRIFEIDERAL